MELVPETANSTRYAPNGHAPATAEREAFERLRAYLSDPVVGQPDLIEKLLVCLLADGHLLIEGAPGLAKTKRPKPWRRPSRARSTVRPPRCNPPSSRRWASVR